MTSVSKGTNSPSPGETRTEGLDDAWTWPAALAQAAQLCQSSPLPMMVWHPSWPAPLFNKACAAIHGGRESELPEQLWRAIQIDAQEVMRTGHALTRDAASLMLPYADAPPIACSSYCLHPLHEHGQTVGVLLIGSRLEPWPWSTWRERMHYAAVIHSMDLGFCMVEVIDPFEQALLDYVFLEVNPAYESHSGLSNLVGRRISEIVTEREPFWSEALRHVLRTGEVLQTTTQMTRSQKSFDVCLIRMGGPGSRQVAILLKNITEQTKAAARLKLSEEQARKAAAQARADSSRLAAVLDASPAAVIVIDANNQITLANAQARQAWGNIPESGSMAWVGHWADGSVRHGRRLQPSQWPLSRALLGHSSRDIIEITSPRDGVTRRTFLCSGSPIWGVNLSVDGAVVVAMDITDRVEAEKALRTANSHKDEFLAMLGHELRNPLAPIAMAAELMSQPGACDDRLRETSSIITRQVRHMRGLIDDLLDTARVSQGLIRLDLRGHNLQTLIYEAVEQTQELLQQMDHRLELDLPQAPLIVEADGKRIVQVIANLLHNAAKYTPAHGLIELRVWTGGEAVYIEVADNGIGMSEDTLRRAFELFSQAEREADRQQGGLGLGLALVKKLVELHGGRIAAESPGPSLGSSFTLQLPLRRSRQAKDAAPRPIEGPRTTPQLHILLVDDNRDAARTLSMFLTACGHECRVAPNAEEALTLTADAMPDVFILDIGLPGMDGKELARQLRARQAAAKPLIIALSGYAQPDEQKKALSAGFDHYLVKPVDVDRLSELLRGVANPQSAPGIAPSGS